MPEPSLPFNEADRLKALESYQLFGAVHTQTFDNLAHLAAHITRCPISLISLVDAARQWFLGRYGVTETETPREVAFCAHAILEPANPLIVNDARSDALFADNPLVTGVPGIRFYAGMPLVSPSGHALGTLCAIDFVPRVLNLTEVEMLAALARAVMAALEAHKAASLAAVASANTVSHFVQLIEAMPAALVLTGSDGRIKMVNKGTERLFGYERVDLQDRLLEVLVPERHRQDHILSRQNFMTDMSTRAMGGGKELFGQRRDGTEFPLEIGLNPIDFEGERMTLAAVFDISDRHMIEAERKLQADAIARHAADLQEFAYGASHDLRAPLHAIGRLAGWIREDIDLIADAETLQNLSLLEGRVGRLRILLDGMLAYAVLGATERASDLVDIGEVIRDIVAMIDLPVGFSVECAGNLPTIRTHPSPIKAVLINLIGNGIQHHDRATGRITVSAQLRDGMAAFRVSDDGPGISFIFHEKIFQIFQTLEPRDDREASGMGLAIVRKAVTDHGGKIWVESNPPERGTTFCFTWKIDQ